MALRYTVFVRRIHQATNNADLVYRSHACTHNVKGELQSNFEKGNVSCLGKIGIGLVGAAS